ncbi:hypothetical protein ACH4SK_29575 [Streptomyces inhibens]|uniref:hypothetical protein n=1 Tax=Streptomyces inhibens TaxID=2293571 RepID=UPI0037920B81
MDRMLPDIDGLRVLHLLREELKTICLHFLAIRDAVEDRIAGITAGDDTGQVTGSRPGTPAPAAEGHSAYMPWSLRGARLRAKVGTRQ